MEHWLLVILLVEGQHETFDDKSLPKNKHTNPLRIVLVILNLKEIKFLIK